MKPRDILSVARSLLGAEPAETREARGRSAVSRAYYAAYHAALQFADEVGAPTAEDVAGGVHKQLSVRLDRYAAQLQGDEKRSVTKLRSLLNTLCDWRVEADYQLNFPANPLKPAQAVDLCERIMDGLNNLRGTSAQEPGSAA